MKKIIILGLFVLFGIMSGNKGFSETFNNYQTGIQTTFMREAANKNNFVKAVQTARLLAYLEFMEPESFNRFYQCMSKDGNWDYMSAKKREVLLNSCRAEGRSVSGAVVAGPVTTLSPALSQRREQETERLQKEIDDLRNLVEKLSVDVRNNQDQVMQTLQSFGQSAAPQPVREQAPVGQP